MAAESKHWDAQGYQARHSYVFRYGQGVVELLDPQKGERIVDLGCGSGQLTAEIAARGASVIGIDRSEEMIAQARANFSEIDFRIADATTFEIDGEADAVFSNAALHWIKDARGAIDRVWRALKPGGRFVLEMGGKGNAGSVVRAVREVAGEVELPWYYPTVAEYAALLEARGFEPRMMTLFDRPTEVEGENGLEDWLIMFGSTLFRGMDEARQREIRRAIADRLRPAMYRDGSWWIDYRRLRVVAVKL